MKKVFIRTYGCKTNQYESQVLKELSVKNGYELVEDYKNADVVIINSCAVTQPAERDIYKFIRRVYRDSGDKKFYLVGCYAEYIKLNNKFELFFNRLEIPVEVNFFGTDERYKCVVNDCNNCDEKITNFFGHTRAYVKIQDGCNCYCTYCIVPYLRKNLYSKPKDKVIEEIIELEKNGYKEIVLVGTNIGLYKSECGDKIYDLIDLSEEILLSTAIKLIFSSLEVVHINDKFFSFLEKYKSRIFPHFHIPLQSGDDKVLNAMNRKYTVSEYKEKILKLRKVIPDAIISTDIIVGYPEETKEQFYNTMKLVREIKFNWLHVFPYSSREHTVAHKKYNGFVPYDVKLRAREMIKLNEELGEKYYKKLCRVE